MLDPTERQSKIFGKLLYFFAGYTLVIKYILPVGWAVIQKAPMVTYIYFWDAWWVAHIIVGRGLALAKKGIWPWAFSLSVAEIIIIAVKFFFYLKFPNLDFWHVNWFVNKTFLLIYFSVLLAWLFKQETRKVL